MPRRKASQQDLTGAKKDGAPKVGVMTNICIPAENVSTNKSLDALFHITDLELQNISKNSPGETSGGKQSPIDGSGGGAATFHQVVRLPGQEKGIEKYQLKSDSLEEQGLKLVYTKHTHEQYQHNPVSYGSYRPRGFKEAGGATSPQILPEVTVGRKRKHPQKPGRHICPYCQRGCAKPSVLQKHIRAHTGERPYPCIPCGFSFKTKSNLYKHCKSRAHAIKVGQSPNFEGAKFGGDDITDSEDNDSCTDSEGDTPTSSPKSKPVTSLSGGSSSMVYNKNKDYYDIIPTSSETSMDASPANQQPEQQQEQQNQQQQLLLLSMQQQQQQQMHENLQQQQALQMQQQPPVIVIEEETRAHTPPPEPTEATTALRQLEVMSDEIAEMAANANVSITSSIQTLPDKVVKVTIQLKRPKSVESKTDVAKGIKLTHSITKPVDHKAMSSEMLQDRIQQLIMENQAIVDTAPILEPPRQKRLSRQNSETPKSGNQSPKSLSGSGEQTSDQSFLEVTEASDRPPEIQMKSGLKLSEEISSGQEIKISLKLPKPVENLKCPTNPEGSVIKNLLLKGFESSQSRASNSSVNEQVGFVDSETAVDNYGPYLCKPCNVSFRKEASLQMHQKLYCPLLCRSTSVHQAENIRQHAEREREILNKIFPEVPVTPVSPTKTLYDKSACGSVSSETSSTTKKKGKPKLSKAKTKLKEHLELTPVPVSVNVPSNLSSPTPSGGTMINMFGQALPPTAVIPVGRIILNEGAGGLQLKRSFSVPSSSTLLNNESSPVMIAPKTQSPATASIHSKIETIISNTHLPPATQGVAAPAALATAVPVLASSQQPGVKQENMVPTSGVSSKNWWKHLLRGKLLMKRSMSVERMLSSEDADKSPTPTKLMSHPNLTCPLPPEAPRLMRSVTIDALPSSSMSASSEDAKSIKPHAMFSVGSMHTPIITGSLSASKPSFAKVLKTQLSVSHAQRTNLASKAPVAVIPFAQAGAMPMVPSIIQGSVIRIPMLRAKSLETMTLPTSLGTCIVFPQLSLPAVPPHQASFQQKDTTPVSMVTFTQTSSTKTSVAASPSASNAESPTASQPSVVQSIPLMLAGHNLPSLRSSTHMTFCCVQQNQPMYVQQGANRKISMYSNWRVAAYNPNPHGLTARMLFSLYKSRQYPSNPSFAMSKVGSSLPGSLTHSSYWNYYNKLKAIQSSQNVQQEMKISPTATASGDVFFSTDDVKGLLHTTGSDKCNDLNAMKNTKVAAGYKSNDIYVYVRGRGRGKYVCEECGIRCKKPSMLKKHIRTHTDLRPYSCKHCNFSFKTKGNLTKHMKSKAHHKKCTELGIVPVPTAVEDSQIDNDALERQQEISRESKILEDEAELKARRAELVRHESMDMDDEDDDDDCDDEDEDESEDDSGDEEPELVINEEHDRNNVQRSLPHGVLQERVGGQKVVVLPVDNDKGLVPAPGGSVPGNGMVLSSSENRVNEAVLQRQAIDAEIARSLLDLSKHATDHKALKESKDNEARGPSKDPLGGVLAPLMTSQNSTRAQTSSLPSPSSLTQATRGAKRKASDDIGLVETSIKRTTLPSTPVSLWPLAASSSCGYIPSCVYKPAGSGFIPPVITSGRGPIIGQLISSVPTPTTTQSFPFQFVHPFPLVNTMVDSATRAAQSHLTCKEEPVNLCVKDDGKVKNPTEKLNSPGEKMSPSTPRAGSKVFFVTSDNRAPFEILPIPGRVAEDSNSVVDGKFVCGVCQKSFAKQHLLTLHKNIHFFENSYKCTDCAVSFRTEALLERHLQSDSHCNKQSSSVQSGSLSDNPRPFRCEYCKMGFRIQGHLAKHVRCKSHIVALERQGKLPVGAFEHIQRKSIDLKDCDTLESLRAIFNLGDKAIEEQSDSQDSDNTSSERGPGPVFSPPSINTYERNSQASNERVTVEIKNEPIEMYDVSQRTEDTAESTASAANSNQVAGSEKTDNIDAGSSNTKSLQCGICDHVFDKLTMLKQHLVSHAELRPHVCEYCDAGFTTAQSLKVHLRTHKQERPYVCGHCGDTFPSSDSLQTHATKGHSPKDLSTSTNSAKHTNSSQ